jgi:hypothetical protein
MQALAQQSESVKRAAARAYLKALQPCVCILDGESLRACLAQAHGAPHRAAWRRCGRQLIGWWTEARAHAQGQPRCTQTRCCRGAFEMNISKERRKGGRCLTVHDLHEWMHQRGSS